MKKEAENYGNVTAVNEIVKDAFDELLAEGDLSMVFTAGLFENDEEFIVRSMLTVNDSLKDNPARAFGVMAQAVYNTFWSGPDPVSQEKVLSRMNNFMLMMLAYHNERVAKGE